MHKTVKGYYWEVHSKYAKLNVNKLQIMEQRKGALRANLDEQRDFKEEEGLKLGLERWVESKEGRASYTKE